MESKPATTSSSVEQSFKELVALAQNLTDPKLQFILLIHASNLSEGLKCTGILEDDSEGDYILPPNWNKDSEGVYSFRYHDAKAKDTLYFKLVTEDTLIDVNAVTASKNDKIVSLNFNISDYTQLDTPNISEIYKRYRNEFLVNILPYLKRTEEPAKREPERRFIIEDAPRDFFWNAPRNNFPGQNPLNDYGRNDLYPVPQNPFGINSGGNLLGPRNPLWQGGQPIPGNNPGGIRFDPVGPGNIDPTNPDPDIFLPQGPLRNDPRNPFGGRGPFGGPGAGGFGGGFI